MDFSDIDLYRAYFGKDADYYLERLEKFNNGNKFIFNGYAFFFGILWFAYRKMYVEAIAIFGGIIFIEILINIIFNIENSNIDRFSGILYGLITGFIANYLYISKAKRIVEKVKNENDLSHDEPISYLSKEGGTSWAAVFVAILMVGALVAGGIILELAIGIDE